MCQYRGNGHKEKHRFQLNIRKHFFPVRVTKHWHKLPREIVESPSLETFKSSLDMVLGNLLQVILLEQGDHLVTSFVNEKMAVDVFYLGFSKTFDTVSDSTLIDKLTKYGLDK
ncbi:hypothetical protein QYF61_012539 [Mycteria americana]|uniref:Reverse transcriptase domain-containing protein n=1 Tax=Mycteria americana TaxID=33587 RepID=A0AAN7S3B9_MYCAM|nr:hypothetical protein QYF61_012539 [Mycteria americana]